MPDAPLPDVLAAGPTAAAHPPKPPIATFPAYAAGYCRRQLYLTLLNLTTGPNQGKLTAGRLVHTYIEDHLTSHHPDYHVNPTAELDAPGVTITGSPTCLAPDETVYHVKPRNGWYKFNPPVDRHVDQLHAYMAGLDVDHGQLLYISKNDLTAIRPWPSDGPTTRDPDRVDAIIARCREVRDEIIMNGIATQPDDIPYPRCGCYLCDAESLSLPAPPRATRPHDTSPTTSQSPTVETPGESNESAAVAASDGGQVLRQPQTDPERLERAGYRIPAPLQSERVWVVWDGQSKQPRAPWVEDTMYPCRWAADADTDPRETYEKAAMVAELPVKELHRSWPFPDDTDLPETVLPGILLPHDPGEEPVTVIDFDAVRDPDSGVVSGEVVAWLEAFSGYAEVSSSGTGIHVFVRGGLPGDSGAFAASLEATGSVEIYDRSRFVATTWQHLATTPADTIPRATGTIADLVATYQATQPP